MEERKGQLTDSLDEHNRADIDAVANQTRLDEVSERRLPILVDNELAIRHELPGLAEQPDCPQHYCRALKRAKIHSN